MIKFCRSCGRELAAADDKICKSCGANAVKATSNCRYCGKPTAHQDLTCPTCGSAIKPIPGSVKALNKENPKLIKLGKIINLTIVAIIVTAYIVFSLPPKVTKPVKAAASDAMLATTGYTALPLNSIAATPPRIPQLVNVMFDPQPAVVSVNTTRQLTVYAIYKNINTGNATKAIRLEEITTNCTYQSSNEKVATVNATGLVRATGSGEANIVIFYTVAPGSANMSNAAVGKVPVTFNTTVPVFVR
ncbi:MAG: Ig-like domain-containing protein [Dehalococcoidales bacterium]|nr:Ig-like domain-containing protein [Dehalococcoidales bacterium]